MSGKPTTIAPAKFAHVALRTAQKNALRDWYCTVLGADVPHEDDAFCFLSYDEEHHRIAILQQDGLAPATPGAAGMHHMAYTYRSLEELLVTYERLKAAGITPWLPINHGMTTSLYYRDPDGNSVELQKDNFATAEDCTTFMHSGAFAKNPVGVSFDPDAALAALRNGTPAAKLIAYDA